MIRRATRAPALPLLLALLALLTASPLGGAAAHAATSAESALAARERLVLIGVPVDGNCGCGPYDLGTTFERAGWASVADVVYAKMGLTTRLVLRPPDPEAQRLLGVEVP